MIYSLTASHYDCKIKGLLLKFAIESLIKIGVDKCFVSMSFNDKTHYAKYKYIISELEKIYPQLKVYIHLEKMFQFQHLQFLSKNIEKIVNLDDKIIFCDDDDIILKLPDITKSDIICGYHWITDFVENDISNFNNYQSITKIIENNDKSKWRKEIDFGGYICPYKLLKDFFHENKIDYTDKSQLNIMYLQLIDCKFMNFLDSKISYKPDVPFCYHRIWQTKDRNIQLWRKNFMNLPKINTDNYKKKILFLLGFSIILLFGYKKIL